MLKICKSFPLYLCKLNSSSKVRLFTNLAKSSSSQLHTSIKSFQSTEQKLQTNPTNLARNAQKKVINPLKHEDFFGVNELVKLEELFK